MFWYKISRFQWIVIYNQNPRGFKTLFEYLLTLWWNSILSCLSRIGYLSETDTASTIQPTEWFDLRQIFWFFTFIFKRVNLPDGKQEHFSFVTVRAFYKDLNTIGCTIDAPLFWFNQRCMLIWIIFIFQVCLNGLFVKKEDAPCQVRGFSREVIIERILKNITIYYILHQNLILVDTLDSLYYWKHLD